MVAARQKRNWSEVVALMRLDARELGRSEGQSARFLQRFTGSMDALAAQLRRDWGLNAHEMHAVIVLWEFGRMTMTELGRRIPLSRAAVTTLTDRLERLGYVNRVPDPSDRRRILLDITEKVEDQLQTIHGQWNERVEQYVQQLEPELWGKVVDVLADLREIAREEADAIRTRHADDYVKPITRGIERAPRPDDTTGSAPDFW